MLLFSILKRVKKKNEGFAFLNQMHRLTKKKINDN